MSRFYTNNHMVDEMEIKLHILLTKTTLKKLTY